jgi:hypothetical protein
MESLIVSNSTKSFAFYNRTIRFIKVGILLHVISIVGLLVFLKFGKMVLISLNQGFSQALFFNGFISIDAFVIIVFAQLDAISRFQNYKLAKDLFFEKGFQKRIANLFISSKCQREAIMVAANDLGISEELEFYLKGIGYCWFHVIPDMVLLNPGILFTQRFWENTLFVKSYDSKYFSW